MDGVFTKEMNDEMKRWEEYRKLLDRGVKDWSSNDFITRSVHAPTIGADRARDMAMETRNIQRYGMASPDAATRNARNRERGLSQALDMTDSFNRAQMQQYDMDKLFANQLIGIGHGVGTTADDLRGSINAANNSRENAYNMAKNQADAADAAGQRQLQDALLATAISWGASLI